MSAALAVSIAVVPLLLVVLGETDPTRRDVVVWLPRRVATSRDAGAAAAARSTKEAAAKREKRSPAPESIAAAPSAATLATPASAPGSTAVEAEIAAAAGPEAPAQPGRVIGRVVVEASGEALQGAVTIVARPARRRGDAVRDQTDALGRFTLELGAGRWTLAAEVEGWASSRVAARVEAGEQVEVEPITLVAAADALVGSVVAADGRGIAGARVTVERGGSHRMKRRVVTGADGAFRAERLPEGLYTVTAEAEGFVTARARRVPVAEGRGGVAPPLVLARAGSVTGTVRGPDGRLRAGVEVTVHRGRGKGLASVKTDDQGAFALDRLGAGPAQVFARAHKGALAASAAIVLEDGRSVALPLVLAEAPRVAGRVAGAAGDARVGVRVEATSREGDVRARATTDADGRYALTRLVPGAYVVRVVRRGSPPAASARVQVSSGETRCDLVFEDGTTLSGVVVGRDGAPQARAMVFAVIDGRERARARTDAQGRFALRGLPEAAARLLVRGHRDAVVAEVPILVPPDAVVDGLRLVAHPPARLVGFARDATGRPLEDLSVVVRGGPVRRTARTGADGRFETGPFYDGEYQLTADAGSLSLIARKRGVAEVVVAPVSFAVSGARDVALELRASDVE